MILYPADPIPEASRPLQFVPPFGEWCGQNEPDIRANLEHLRALGIGGIVVTVELEDYLRSEAAWELLRTGVRLARETGLRVWIYDEKGYPSGAAGGRVLERYPEGEAQGLVRHEGRDGVPRYEAVTLCEAPHATENFYQKRPYINILDPEAVKNFLEVTHDQYARVLAPIGESVEAFFTDEPSLIASYIPAGRSYPPTIPWHRRFPEFFRQWKGYDLTAHMESLFDNTGGIDRKIRCDFYEVLTHLCAEAYFGQLQQWCALHGVLSSGHLLGEETLVWQTLFNGDPFECYRRFDIPGIDMILSDPGRILNEHFFIVPVLAGSAGRLMGKRRLMCEISDFLGHLDGRHASVEQMQCTSALLSALGVTDFVSMYQPPVPTPPGVRGWPKPPQVSERDYRAYAVHTGRVNAVFARGRTEPQIAILYPLTSVWAHFTPSNRSMYEPHPDPTVGSIDGAFTALCRDLLTHQLEYDIVDEGSLGTAEVEGPALEIGASFYRALVLPPADTLRLRTMEVISRFAAAGGTVLMHSMIPRYSAGGEEEDRRVEDLAASIRAGGGSVAEGELVTRLREAVPPHCTLSPPSPHVLCVRLTGRDGKVYCFVNTSSTPFVGNGTFRSAGEPILFDVASGERRGVAGEMVDPGKTSVVGTRVDAALAAAHGNSARVRPTGNGIPPDAAGDRAHAASPLTRLELELHPYQTVFVYFTQHSGAVSP